MAENSIHQLSHKYAFQYSVSSPEVISTGSVKSAGCKYGIYT